MLQILSSSGVLGMLRSIMPYKSLSEILNALQDDNFHERLESITPRQKLNEAATADYLLGTEDDEYLDDINRLSRNSLQAADRFAMILNLEVQQRLVESQLARLRNLYINNGLLLWKTYLWLSMRRNPLEVLSTSKTSDAKSVFKLVPSPSAPPMQALRVRQIDDCALSRHLSGRAEWFGGNPTRKFGPDRPRKLIAAEISSKLEKSHEIPLLSV